MDNDETNGDVQDDEISEEPTEESSKENSDESSEAANQENTGTLDTGSSEAAETTPDVEAGSASFVESSESGNASSEVRELDMIGINNGITLSDNEINLQECDEYQLLIDVGMG